MNNTEIKLLVGESVADPAELNLINRLRTDLEQRGIPAVLYANFFTNARQRLQIDLLVRTATRTAHVEIKGLNPQYPVRGGQNGEWVQKLPGGEERSLGKNCGRQARDGTYAISDAMRNLARSGRVTPCEGEFYRHIDSIVAIWETVPDGSEIDPPDYVKVMGYSELVERLAVAGRAVPWSDDDWDEFARCLGLYLPEETSESERHRRDSLAMAADYRLNAQNSLGEGLGPFVELGAAGGDGDTLTAGDLERRIASGAAVAIVGPSGGGKSHWAKHLAVGHCDAGRIVVWAQASDYTKGDFWQFLARAIGPFSAEPWLRLIDSAVEAGVAITVVVDGLNECPAGDRAELLLRLRAFTRHYSAGLLVTSTDADGLTGTLGAEMVCLSEPDGAARAAILDAYGAKRPERISSQSAPPTSCPSPQNARTICPPTRRPPTYTTPTSADTPPQRRSGLACALSPTASTQSSAPACRCRRPPRSSPQTPPASMPARPTTYWAARSSKSAATACGSATTCSASTSPPRTSSAPPTLGQRSAKPSALRPTAFSHGQRWA